MLKEKTLQAARLINILPDEDITVINKKIIAYIKKWDPDFTRLTPEEKEELEKSEMEMASGEYIKETDFWK